MKIPKLIIFDRDGVINRMVVHEEHGTLDSPMNVNEVSVPPEVPRLLSRLHQAGILLAIATNQPAAAKGKTTMRNLEFVHAEVLSIAESCGAKIATSQICFHRKEDGCDCRKPKAGLLKNAQDITGVSNPRDCWMVGDAVTDIKAGASLGIPTAFIGARKADMISLFAEYGVNPDFWGESLAEFVDFVLS